MNYVKHYETIIQINFEQIYIPSLLSVATADKVLVFRLLVTTAEVLMVECVFLVFVVEVYKVFFWVLVVTVVKVLRSKAVTAIPGEVTSVTIGVDEGMLILVSVYVKTFDNRRMDFVAVLLGSCSEFITLEWGTSETEGVGKIFVFIWVENNDGANVDCIIMIDDDLVLTTEGDLDIAVVDEIDRVGTCGLLVPTDVVYVDDCSIVLLQIDGNRFTPYMTEGITHYVCNTIW